MMNYYDSSKPPNKGDQPPPATHAAGDILLVDDNPANLAQLSDLLSGRGYQVRASPSGALGLRAARRRPPDLILLDIMMPDQDGIEVCRTLKADPALAPVPVIFISALQESRDKLKAFDAGGVDFITKPFDFSEVLSRVRTHLQLYRLQRQLENQNQRLEQRVAERTAELEQSREKFAKAFQQAPVMVALSELQGGRFREVNQTLCRKSGFTADELLGRTASEMGLVSAADERQVERRLRRHGQIHGMGLTLNARSGKQRECQLFAQTLRIGQEPCAVILLEDMSKHNKTERKLRRAKQSAEAANQAKSAFLANMSHELRTPLNSILGYAQVLQTRPDVGPEARRRLEVMQRSGQYLLTLINDLLDLTKIELNRVELSFETMELKGLLDSQVELFSLRARQKGIGFRMEIRSELPPLLRTDERRLRQVLINLLSNAVKFTEKGEVTLAVSYHQGHLLIEVTDTGIGIPEDRLDQVFEPFAQAGERNYRAQGTGLGLTITRRLLKLMGAELEAESRPGHGSRFSIRIPAPPVLRQDHTPKHAPPLAVAGYRALSPLPPAARFRVLATDDDTDNRNLLREWLEPLGFEVLEAANGWEAVRTATAAHPHIILMDLVMPEMDGLKATRIIRDDPELAPVPIIAVSASATHTDRSRTFDAGCNDHLSKPLLRDDLLQILAKNLPLTWIEAAEKAPQPPAPNPEADQDDAALDALTPNQWARLKDTLDDGNPQHIDSLLTELDAGRSLVLVARLREMLWSFELNRLREIATRGAQKAPSP